MNKIEVYQQNSKTISCVIAGLDITDYTPYFTIKKSSSDTTTYLSKTGVVSDASTCIFSLLPADTSLSVGEYVYDITVSDASNNYTVVKDSFVVLDSVRF